ncbi:methylated-DNA--[protein]-cysteine S-methyltransferase [Candidatus Sarmatiella mevalonica]|uniref:methylated-DNA--[protein]-cysteine S-methyltransferase n=1 Tax=Candidatus Sarmatiella mevalonica TaxID=2770581 RepID=UPI001920A43E|nr:methylated-DNA--[protein]-cysteine S-methyltransferase [Candidatus Sarmatiella mevalonica]
MRNNILKQSLLYTKLGEMLVIADEERLYLLAFTNKPQLECVVKKIVLNKNATKVVNGITHPIESIKKELQLYFDGILKKFSTSFQLIGTPFQISVWNALLNVPYGQTKSYSLHAQNIGKNMAHRAVANANGANRLAIIVPCHRIIRSDGNIGGYSGGNKRKQWLIHHEQHDT